MMRIVRDSREQRGYDFNNDRYDVELVEGTLQTGDYSIQGCEHLVSIERKSLSDLIGCLGHGRDRFQRELLRAAALPSFCVIVEASWRDLVTGNFRGQLDPHSGAQSVLAWMSRLHVPFLFAGSRDAGEYCTWSFLKQFMQGKEKELRAIMKAAGATA